MGKTARILFLVAIAFFLCSCAAYDDAMGTFRKTFPGRNDKPAADNSATK